MINYFFRLQNFDKLFNIFTKILPILIIFLTIIAGYKIYYSPDDYQQSNAVKIMYIHVPSAWMSLLIYSLMAIFNVSAFIWRNRFYYLIARAIAEVGAVFTFIT